MPVGGALLRRRSPRTRSEVRDACTKVVEKVATHGILMGGALLRRRSPKIHPEDRDAWTKLSKKIVQKTRSGKIERLGRHEEEPNGLQECLWL